LHIVEEELLGAEYAAGSAEADIADEGGSWELVVFHRVTADQSASATQTRFAVHSDPAGAVRFAEICKKGYGRIEGIKGFKVEGKFGNMENFILKRF
jgi:CRISPR/Cas system-associated protein endoribonuclease Cas2